MKASRKYIRIALTSEDEEAFKASKEAAEAATGLGMSDAMYALSVIRRAIKPS